MPPKEPDEVRAQAEKQNAENPAAEGKSRTAEGLEVPNPSRKEFFENLEQVARPDDKSNGQKAEGQNPDPSI